MAKSKLGFAYFGGIGDCLRILVLFHGPLLQFLNRGKTPVRWNDGGSAGNQLVDKYIISRIPGLYPVGLDEQFFPILNYPGWHRFFRWTRTPLQFRLTNEEKSVLPKLSPDKPNVAICPHHNGLACKKLPVTSVNRLLATLREKLDANYYVFDERVDQSTVDAPCITGLNLTQAMVLMARFDAAVSIDSWQKYIMGMHNKPQTCLVVDFRKNESYTHEGPPEGVYREFFHWRMKPGEILGFQNGFTEFRWMNAAQVEPEILADHLLAQVAGRPRFSKWMRG